MFRNKLEYKKDIKELFTKSDTSIEEELKSINVKSFNLIAILLCIVGAISTLSSVPLLIRESLFHIIIIDIIALLLLTIITFNRKIPLTIKQHMVAGGFFVLGAVILIFRPEGGSFLFLVGFFILSSIFFKVKGFIFSLSLTFIFITITILLVYNNMLNNFPISDKYIHELMPLSLNMLLIGSMASLPVAFWTSNFEKKLVEQKNLRKQLEENLIELEEAKEKSEESNRLKSNFLTNMSHEIRTPLNAIIGFSELMMTQADSDKSLDDYKDYIFHINENGYQLLNIINNILSISIINSGELQLFKDKIKIKSIFSNLKNIYNSKSNLKEFVPINFELTKNQEQVELFTDEQQILQVFTNLIDNAIKYTPKGNITVGYNIKNQCAEFFVKDTGSGIAPTYVKNIFDYFSKDNEFSGNKEGIGLGLAICKNVVEILNGKIWVDSELGKGSTFYFTQPLEQNI